MSFAKQENDQVQENLDYYISNINSYNKEKDSYIKKLKDDTETVIKNALTPLLLKEDNEQKKSQVR